jgi:hypothetical protein
LAPMIGMRTESRFRSNSGSRWWASHVGANLGRRKVGPHIGTTTAAALTGEPRLEIRQTKIVRPAVVVQGNVMAAMAIDQHAAQAHLSHLAEGDLHRPTVGVSWRVAFLTRHDAIEALRRRESNCRLMVVRSARELLRVVGVEMQIAEGDLGRTVRPFATSSR